MRVCAKLGVPFITIDAEKEYKKEVVDYMLNEYKNRPDAEPGHYVQQERKIRGVFEESFSDGSGLHSDWTLHKNKI